MSSILVPPSELICTHIGADFDALASMVAARRFYPHAAMFFPGSQEESVRRMLADGFFEIDFLRMKQIDPEALRRIVLCDSRQAHRLGVIAEWLERYPQIACTAFDHHPNSASDVPCTDGGCTDPTVGATSTLLAERLRREKVPLSPEEASLLLMGIYEDTGSLSFPTVSRRDLEAVAWLLERGGDLAAVRRYAMRRLDSRRLEILHQMTQSLTVHLLHGHAVGIVAIELGGFVDELAPLVSRCLEIFELPMLFAFFGEGESVAIIARGEVPGVDLGKILAAAAQGGGHATAAAARLRKMTALEAAERLLGHLQESLPPAALAADLMIREFRTVDQATAVADAKERLNRWRLNAVPVTDIEKRVVGALTRQILDSAIQHGLGERPVSAVMDTDLEWVEPTAPAEEIADRMTTRHPRLVLVGRADQGRAEGLVTRMQMLRHLHGRLEAAGAPLARRLEEHRRIHVRISGLIEGLDGRLREIVDAVAGVARDHGISVALVGGFVRDLLLERPTRDLDLVVEGDGPQFARLLIDRLGGRVRVHEAFMTAACLVEGGDRIDVASARSEFYRAPAALPEVQTSALRQDLYRRDFTINTLAIRLGPESEPMLIDHFGGRRDLRRGVLRVLHSLSFIDDPTRVMRAVRLESRLGFEISPETLRLIRVALDEGVFDRLSGGRLRQELKLLLDDPQTVETSISRLAELDLLRTVHPLLAGRFDGAARGRLRAAVAACDWYRLEGLQQPTWQPWRLFLMTLVVELCSEDLRELVDRLNLAGEDRSLLLEFRGRSRRASAVLRRSSGPPHRVVETLEALTGEEVLLAMAIGGDTERRWVRRALVELAPIQLSVRGADLIERGQQPGPAIGRALRATRAARLDGKIEARDELEYSMSILSEEATTAAASARGAGSPWETEE